MFSLSLLVTLNSLTHTLLQGVGVDQWQRGGIAVSIVTGLRVGWFGVRIRVGAIFSAPARTGPRVHLASYKWVAGFISRG